MPRGVRAIPVGESASNPALVIDLDPYNEEDILAVTPGFKPITAYSVLEPNLKIAYETTLAFVNAEAADPEHRFRRERPTIRFRWGVYLCTTPTEVEVLKKKPGIYFENLPDGVAAPICKKCRWSCRNQEAMIRHMETHLD